MTFLSAEPVVAMIRLSKRLVSIAPVLESMMTQRWLLQVHCHNTSVIVGKLSSRRFPSFQRYIRDCRLLWSFETARFQRLETTYGRFCERTISVLLTIGRKGEFCVAPTVFLLWFNFGGKRLNKRITMAKKSFLKYNAVEDVAGQCKRFDLQWRSGSFENRTTSSNITRSPADHNSHEVIAKDSEW